MSILEQAELDLKTTLENLDDFGIAIKLFDSDDNEYNLVGKSNDIGFFLDMNTGMAFRGRTVEVDLRLSSIISAGAGSIVDDSSEWRFKFKNVMFAVRYAPVDRTLGILKLQAEAVENVT